MLLLTYRYVALWFRVRAMGELGAGFVIARLPANVAASCRLARQRYTDGRQS